MKLEVTQDIANNEQIYTLTIPYFEWMKARIYPQDKLLFDECDKSDKLSDKILGLETLVRRIEEVR